MAQLVRGTPATCVVSVWRCDSCRHLWADPVPTPAALGELYERSNDGYFVPQDEEEFARAARTVSILNDRSPARGRLLDVGCGQGTLMREAQVAGWDVVGFEPVESFARTAEAIGPVYSGHLSRMRTDRKFDAITIIEVLEHVHDPVGLLRAARQYASEGAYLVAESPNAARLDARLIDKILRLAGHPWVVRTNPLRPPFHLSEFSLTSMRVALELANWRVVEVHARRMGHDDFGLPAPLRVPIRAIDHISGWVNRGHSVTAVAVAD